YRASYIPAALHTAAIDWRAHAGQNRPGKETKMSLKLDQKGDRRGFLKCMQWAGARLILAFSGGVAGSRLLGAPNDKTRAADFSFVQISDSHIGFNKPANTDVNGTLQLAVDQINAAIQQPDFILHTGDLTHLAKASEFDTLEQILKGLRQKEVFYVPGEHDITGECGRLFIERVGKATGHRR